MENMKSESKSASETAIDYPPPPRPKLERKSHRRRGTSNSKRKSLHHRVRPLDDSPHRVLVEPREMTPRNDNRPIRVDGNSYISLLSNLPPAVKKEIRGGSVSSTLGSVSSTPSRVMDLRERLTHPMSISANPFSPTPGSTDSSVAEEEENVTLPAEKPMDPINSAELLSRTEHLVTQHKSLSSGVVANVPPLSGKSSNKVSIDPDPFASNYSSLDRVKSPVPKDTGYSSEVETKSPVDPPTKSPTKAPTTKGPTNAPTAISNDQNYSISIKYCDNSGNIEDVGVAPNEHEKGKSDAKLGKSVRQRKRTIEDPNDISMYFQSGEPMKDKEKWQEDASWMNENLIGPSRGEKASSKHADSKLAGSKRASSKQTSATQASSKQASSKHVSSELALRKNIQGNMNKRNGHRKERPKKERMVPASSRGKEEREAKQGVGIKRRYKRDSRDDDLFEDISKMLLSLGYDDEAATHAVVLHSLLPSCDDDENHVLSKESAGNMLTTMVDSIESLVLDHSCGFVDDTFERRRRTASISSSSSYGSSATSFSSVSASQNYSIDDQWGEREVIKKTANFEDEHRDTDAVIKDDRRMMPVKDDSIRTKKTGSRQRNNSADTTKTPRQRNNSADTTKTPRGMGQGDSKDIIISDIKDSRKDANQVVQTKNVKRSIKASYGVTLQDDIKEVYQERNKKANVVDASEKPRALRQRQRRTKDLITDKQVDQKVMDDQLRHRAASPDGVLFCGIADELIHDVFSKRALRSSGASPPPLECNPQTFGTATKRRGAGKHDMNADHDFMAATTDNKRWMYQKSRRPKKLVFMLHKLRCQRDEYEDREPTNIGVEL